ncbi:SPOR domain-containing protein [bacterium]|nr:SPOR domain-containing protein [bacterium]MBU1994522.1 SPOR domain-containing protein [bacterium]
MEDKNELNDIILNRGSSANNNKKIILAVATLGVILIIVVMLMNTLTSNGTDNLPQAVLPPEPTIQAVPAVQDEPLFEEVVVVEENDSNNDNLDKIAQRLKQESQAQTGTPQIQDERETQESLPALTQQKAVPAKVVSKAKETPKEYATSSRQYYVQVGSFSKYEPDKKFLTSITNKGFEYKYHKVANGSKTINKVLVGPFESEKEARKALKTIRSSIEPGAFLTKI